MITGRRGELTGVAVILDHRTDLRVTLLEVAGWRWYGRNQPWRYKRIAYLYGPDDGGSGPWAVRVPGTVNTVGEALEWLTPAAVRDATATGRRVERQGDVYAIETVRRCDGRGSSELPASHHWDAESRTLRHLADDDGGSHPTLYLPYPARFVIQKSIPMGREQGRTYAD